MKTLVSRTATFDKATTNENFPTVTLKLTVLADDGCENNILQTQLNSVHYCDFTDNLHLEAVVILTDKKI